MFQSIIISFLFSLIAGAIMAAMAPKPPKPLAGELDVPEPDPSRPVQVDFGTNLHKNANVYWYGDADAKAIKQGGGK